MDARSAHDRSIARFLLSGATVLTGLYVLHTAGGVGPGGQWLEVGVYHVALALGAAACLFRGVRGGGPDRGWLLLGLALVTWTAGDLYWQIAVYDNPVPVPSAADAAYLAMYPLAYAGVLVLLRRRLGRASTSRWLDGIIGGLAVGAVAAAVVVDAVTRSFGGDNLTNLTNLAYPLGDGLLLALIVVSLAATGWRPGRMWLFVSAGLGLFAAADSAYLYLVATDTYSGGIVDCGWSVGALLIAWGAWQPEPPAPAGDDSEGWRVLALPAGLGAVALAMLVYDHVTRVNTPGVVLATLSVLAVMVRMGMAIAENRRLLVHARDEALTDALTGLGNRRRLLLDLEQVTAGRRQRVLALFDLNGFKLYNDTFGHPAGDALLVQLGRRLRAAAAPHGTAYRMGGDEFCVLLTAGGHEVAVLTSALEALSLSGPAFAIDASWGQARMPGEAATASDVLGLADARMYARKAVGRPSPGRQSTDVLLRVLEERHPDLRDHLRSVADLAREVGRRVGLEGADLENVEFAAELHDVGKVAIPDAILSKPGPLDDDELTVIRRHTIIGERIVEAAPALTRAARLVRSSHERWDGGGYPDALAGENIPHGARVVAACDAFEAMTSDRPYRAPLDVPEAIAELLRCAGAQFDPRVVAELVAVVDAGEAVSGGPKTHAGAAAPAA